MPKAVNHVEYNGNTLIDLRNDTVTSAEHIMSGYVGHLADGTVVTGTGQGGGGSVTWETMVDQNVTIASSNPNYFVITNYTTPFSADETYRVTWGSGGTEYICPTKPTEGASQSYDDYFIGNNVYGGGTDTGEPFVIYRDSATRLVCATNQSAGTWHVKIERQTTTSATLITKTITENGTYSASDDNADGYSEVTVNVPSSGGTQMNVQTTQSTTRRNNTSLGSIISLTCAKAGTYDVYWSCARSSTSGTWGSRLYINGTAYGTENTTFTDHVQNNHLTGVTIPANATVAVYGRSRSGYYIYVPQLTIVQTA